MTTVDIGAATYRFGKLDAMQQFHIVRRLLPILASLGVSPDMLRELGGKDNDLGMLAVMAPIMDMVAKMPDAEVNYILQSALSVVQRQQGDNWAPVQNRTGQLMFADIDMPGMIRLAIEALKRNLGGFFG